MARIMAKPRGARKGQHREQPYVPSPDDRARVETMSGLGLTTEDMGVIIDVSRHTVEKHFQSEIRKGRVIADLAVTKNLFKIATGDTPQAAPAAMFWKKVRSRWHEVQRVIHGFDPSAMTEFVRQIISATKKTIPDTCPHCKTNLGLRPALAAELKAMSARLISTLPDQEIVPIPPAEEDVETPATKAAASSAKGRPA